MVSEVATRVAAFGAGLLGARTTCVALQEALRRNAFVRAGEAPVQLWRPGHAFAGGALLIGSNSGDLPLVPFAEAWWDDPPASLQQRPTES
jgi:hypothetical protein